MPEESPAQAEASKPTETKEVPETYDTANATAEVRIRYTADSLLWGPDTFWPQPYLTHYGASSVRLLPQYSDPKFIEENLVYLDSWAKDAETRGLAELTIGGYRRNLRAYAGYLGPLSILPIGVPQLTSYMDHLKTTRGLEGKQLAPHVAALASLYDFLASEAITATNPVPSFRRRFLAVPLREAHKKRLARRQLLSVDHMKLLVHSVSDLRDRALLVVLVKTGVRSGELVAIDVGDIDWKNQAITLKPFRKRTNLLVFFDDETEHLLKTWLAIRKTWVADDNGPLFIADSGRLPRAKVGQIVSSAARRLGLHNPKGDLKARFTPHACRHWFSTHLRRAGMEAEFIQFMRGDSPGRTLDTYLHIDWEEVRHDYLKRIPQLGLTGATPPQVWSAIASRIDATAKQPIVGPPAVLKLPELGPPEPKPNTPRAAPLDPMPEAPAEWTEEAPRQELEPTTETGSGFRAQRGGPKPSTGTMMVRKAMRQDKRAKTTRPRAEYLSLLGAGRSRSPQAANQILNREAKRIFGKPLGREAHLPRPVGKKPKATLAGLAASGRKVRKGRQPGLGTVKLREAMQEDAAAKRVRPRAEYLEILASGGARSAHAADQILNREAKRILGKPVGRQASGANPSAPVVVLEPRRKPAPPLVSLKEKPTSLPPAASPPQSTGRPPNPMTVALRQRMADDSAAGRLRKPAVYVKWLQGKTEVSLSGARQMVVKQLVRVTEATPPTIQPAIVETPRANRRRKKATGAAYRRNR
jgi:integrase/recombinase XerD